MTDNVSKLPENITFDLDAAERPESDIKPPFTTKVAGKVITMIDPENVDWRDLILMRSPAEFIRVALSDEDRRHLLKQDFEGWRLNQLLQAYSDHFDLEKKMADAERMGRLGSV